jgi:tetratricopeptide (TPR) repeat protein
VLRGRVWESLSKNDPHFADERAREDYARALDLNPRSAEARLHLARTLYRQGRAGAAAAHFACLRQSRPDDPEVLLGLARCRGDLNQVADADQILGQLLAGNPNHFGALVERGRLAFHRGLTTEAVSWLRRALAVAPPYDSEPHLLLASCLRARGDRRGAATYRRKARRIEAANLRVEKLIARAKGSPRDAALRCRIGKELRRLGREEDSLSWFYSALESDPHYRPAHAALAEIFGRAGQPQRAARHRRAAAEATP